MANLPSRRWLLLPLIMLLACLASSAQIISVTFAPPALPIYEQPLCPGEGYIWVPGYWAYDNNFGDYFWVPGTWVLAPEPGLLWTPPYWAWANNVYVFHGGYWGPQVGFYGGIPYGYGYFGHGYEGGRWDHGQFYYNRAVNNINVTNIHNVYNTTVVQQTNVNRVSYNGGNGGINARPSSEEEAAARERHVPPVAAQTEHVQTASTNRELRADANHGRPPIAATERPTAFSGSGVVPAKEAGAPYRPPANRPNATSERATAPTPANESVPRQNAPMHAKDLPSNYPRPAAPNTAAPHTQEAQQQQQNKNYQKQQEKLYNQQQKDRQQLQKSQEQEHQKAAQQQANAERQQQMEQQHQQQTQQMVERHQQQQQQMQNRQMQQAPHGAAPAPEKH